MAWLKETAGSLDELVRPVLESLVTRFELYRGEITRLGRELRCHPPEIGESSVTVCPSASGVDSPQRIWLSETNASRVG